MLNLTFRQKHIM